MVQFVEAEVHIYWKLYEVKYCATVIFVYVFYVVEINDMFQ
jgi:hypothetical protein